MKEGYTSARFYSTSLVKAFKMADVKDDNAAQIDLGFATMNMSIGYFVSPDDNDNGIGNTKATKTEYMLDLKGEKITSEQFDAIAKKEDFDKFTFEKNNESFPSDAKVPFFCFFKNAAGKIGVIRVTKAVMLGADPAIVADIKVQK